MISTSDPPQMNAVDTSWEGAKPEDEISSTTPACHLPPHCVKFPPGGPPLAGTLIDSGGGFRHRRLTSIEV